MIVFYTAGILLSEHLAITCAIPRWTLCKMEKVQIQSAILIRRVYYKTHSTTHYFNKFSFEWTFWDKVI